MSKYVAVEWRASQVFTHNGEDDHWVITTRPVFGQPVIARVAKKENANLIAAAPVLLAALRLCGAWLEQHRPPKSDSAREAILAARAAIAMAERSA